MAELPFKSSVLYPRLLGIKIDEDLKQKIKLLGEVHNVEVPTLLREKIRETVEGAIKDCEAKSGKAS